MDKLNMKKKLGSILLVDDDDASNYFHTLIINKLDCAEQVLQAIDGREALKIINESIKGKFPIPSIIFLDINMPGMNGWEFLEEYEKFEVEIKDKMRIVMFTGSINPDDTARALSSKSVIGFKTKFLGTETMAELLLENFPDYF